MKRVMICDITGDGVALETAFQPTLPAGATGYHLVGQAGTKALVIVSLPDGTNATATTLADLASNQADFEDVTKLANAKVAAIKTWLTNNGKTALVQKLDDDGVDTPKKLMQFFLRRVFNEPGLVNRIKDGYS